MITIKTWEMIKALTENPSLEARTNNSTGGYKTVKVADNRICWNGDTYLPFYIVLKEEGHDWEIVTKSVDFMTAINSGKKIRSYVDKRYHDADWYLDCTLSVKIINRKWFIEGGE